MKMLDHNFSSLSMPRATQQKVQSFRSATCTNDCSPPSSLILEVWVLELNQICLLQPRQPRSIRLGPTIHQLVREAPSLEVISQRDHQLAYSGDPTRSLSLNKPRFLIDGEKGERQRKSGRESRKGREQECVGSETTSTSVGTSTSAGATA
jgi:hypothetical protein